MRPSPLHFAFLAATVSGSFATLVSGCSDDPTSFELGSDAASEESDAGAIDAASSDVSAVETGGPENDAAPDAPIGKPSILAAMNAVLATLVNEQKTRSPSSNIAIAITDLSTRDHVSVAGNVEHVSASSPKMIWVASVLKRAGIAATSTYAQAIFELSDNDATGKALDLLSSYNLVNDDYKAWGMPNSAFTQWSFGKTRQASNSPMKLGTNNYFTADDATKFLENLSDGKVLPPAETAKLLEWAKTSPRKGYGGWLGTKLPASVQTTMVHKAGWIPPPSNSRCTNEIGIITPTNGRTYVVAIFARFVNDADYNTKQLPFVEYASCMIYKTMSEDAAYVCN